jgi:prenyltransferase beta subunit
VLAGVTVASAWTACAALGTGTARDSKFQPNLEATVRYLQNAQQEDGGFAEVGAEPNADFSAWVALALAAAGINPRDQTTVNQHYVAGHSAFSYLAENAHKAFYTTDFERELLVVDASGTSPHDFGGVDLAGELLARQILQGAEAGGFPHVAAGAQAGVNDTIFAILALSPIREPAAEAAVQRAAQWLEAGQNCDGSWPTLTPRRQKPCEAARELLPKETEGEVDMTGAAIEALNAARRPEPEGQRKAFEFLKEAQVENGGFPEFRGESEPNVASTAWVVQAMWSAGINPETWLTPSGHEPLGYLASMQQPDGHIRWEEHQELNGMWMTAYVTPAFTGNPLPIPAVPYVPFPLLPPEGSTGSTVTAAVGSGNGAGGTSKRKGRGLRTEGDGTRAPLFSRPQPHSKGHTPGGVRQLEASRHAERHHKRLNPGRARRKTAPTIDGRDTATRRVRHPDTGAGDTGAQLSGAAATSKVTPDTETEVKGVLIGNPGKKTDKPREGGAPGLRSAGVGGDQEQWPMLAVCAAIALLILTGALIERRRPQVTL